MRTLYLDCGMGVAGDMLMGALIELVAEKEAFLRKMNGIGIPGVKLVTEKSVKCGINGTHMKVLIDGKEEKSQDILHDDKSSFKHNHEHDQDHEHQHNHEYAHEHNHEHAHEHNHEHNHEHDHDHEHDHEYNHEHNHDHNNEYNHVTSHEHHRHVSLPDIIEMINKFSIPEEVKKDIVDVYQIIAAAESKVHGRPVSEVHFHEVGMMDAIADITGCALLIHELGIEKIISSPINVGFGQVRCAHGILPVPAPATANILSGIPCYAGAIEGELCTPTGAALLKHFVTKFSQMPPMTVNIIGYGMGNKDFKAANCVRAMLGNMEEHTDEVIELSCNMDDMTPEEIGYATEILIKNGVLDIYTIPIGMKKSRSGILLSVMCKEARREEIAELMFRHTTTIGIREYRCNRMIMKRKEKIIDSSMGRIRVKESSGYGVTKEKMEYEDLRKAAESVGISIREVKEAIANQRF